MSGATPRKLDAGWLKEGALPRLLAVLGGDGEEARVVGGAVRNALLGEPVAEHDVATTAVPDEVVRRVTAAGFKAVPTGIAHGTVTVVIAGEPFEVTARANVLLRRSALDDDTRLDPVLLADARVGKRLWKAEKGRSELQLYVAADNLANVTEPDFLSLPGRLFSAGLNARY